MKTKRARTAATTGPLASEIAAAKLKELDAALAATLERVVGAADDEAVHDMRVAIRKTRTVLKCARPLYGRHHADAVRAAYTVVHRATGALRDEEVLRETLAELGIRGPALAAFAETRARRERALRRHVVALVRRGAVADARALLAALLTLPPHPRRAVAAATFARAIAERARRRVERDRDVDPADIEGMHELRIAYKELRYVCELFAVVLPSDIAEQAHAAARFQKRIGELHDVDMALDSVGRSRLDAAPKARVLAALRRLRVLRVKKYLAEMAPATALPVAGGEERSAKAPPPATRATGAARPVRPKAASGSGRSRPAGARRR